MGDTSDAKLESTMKMFSRDSAVRTTWVGTVTHLHEHLGQLISLRAQQQDRAALEQVAP